MSRYLILGLIILSILVAYLYGRTQTLSDKVIENQAIPAKFEPTTTKNIPTSKPQVIYKTATPIPTQISERRKVSVTFSDQALSGTFYCYEDKANEIMTTQNNLNLAKRGMDNCSSTLQIKIQTCYQWCDKEGQPSCDTCPTGTECNSWLDSVQKERNNLINLKNQHCP